MDFRLGPNFVFSPISYYSVPDEANNVNRDAVSIIPEGASISPGLCAQYTLEIPIPAPAATFPPWNVPLKRERYVAPTQPGKKSPGGGSGISELLRFRAFKNS